MINKKKLLALPLILFSQCFFKNEELVSMPTATFEKMIEKKSEKESSDHFVKNLLEEGHYQTKYDEKAEEMISNLESTVLRSRVYTGIGAVAGAILGYKIASSLDKVSYSIIGAGLGTGLGASLGAVDKYLTWNKVLSTARNYVNHTQIAKDIVRIENSTKYSFAKKLMAALVIFDGFREIQKQKTSLAAVGN